MRHIRAGDGGKTPPKVKMVIIMEDGIDMGNGAFLASCKSFGLSKREGIGEIS